MKRFMKTLILIFALAQCLIAIASIDENDVRRRRRTDVSDYPAVYPFTPFEQNEIVTKVGELTEDPGYLRNIFALQRAGLDEGESATQPWTSTFWPLNQGLIANPYDSRFNPFTFTRSIAWKQNVRRFHRRMRRKLSDWRGLRQRQLDHLAPSEKYDILMGDDSFDLTRRLWDYTEKWGHQKMNAFVTSLDILGGSALDYADSILRDGSYTDPQVALDHAITVRGGLTENIAKSLVEQGLSPSIADAMDRASTMANEQLENYVLKPENERMATWEGICHGWATAAGIIPRPLRYVDFNLGRGKRLRFYPDDIKGLVALTWANSLIQESRYVNPDNGVARGGVIMAGLRCNNPSPARDAWNRFYDAVPDFYSRKLEPRCVGVHPAIWHLSMANIVGKQKRSLIVERKVTDEVDNHPVYGYKIKYFNPYNGDYGSLAQSTVELNDNDQFYDFRSEKTTRLVGVKLKMKYIDWQRPHRKETDSPSDDDKESDEMLYDLELDNEGNIVGGQWRTTEVGSIGRVRANRSQPDFFWVITKDWRPFFQENNSLSRWDGRSVPVPNDWKVAANKAHEFIYKQTHAMGFNDTCKVVSYNSDEILHVPCEHEIPKPQPLLNVVNRLVELSRSGARSVSPSRRSDDGNDRRARRRARRRSR